MPRGRLTVRRARPDDVVHARAAARLIAAAARTHEVARRSTALLREKIAVGRAVLALRGDALVGFGYYAVWEEGRFVSHSGLVVRDDERGRGLGRRLKERLMHLSRREFPGAATMSLTRSPAVAAMNRALGFRRVPLTRLTRDPAFWEGCRGCKEHAAARAAGKRCCAFGMVAPPAAVVTSTARRR